MVEGKKNYGDKNKYFDIGIGSKEKHKKGNLKNTESFYRVWRQFVNSIWPQGRNS